MLVHFITASRSGYIFSPASYEFDDLSENQVADFAQTTSQPTSQISNGFFIVPNSTTATPNASGGGDISGTWTETDQYGSSTWKLTEDTGGNVSGTVNFTNGGSCGTITYQTVTGSQSNGVFTLTASNPALQDSCGYPITPTEQQSVTLSTSGSCTTGSANWSSEFSAGTSTWKGQVPDSLAVVTNGVHVYTNAEAIAAGFESNCSGIVIGITYQVLAKGKPYQVAGLVPQEMLSNDVEDGVPQHPSIFDPPIWFQFVDIYPGHPEKNTNAAGIFSDAPFGACHSGNTAPAILNKSGWSIPKMQVAGS